MPEINFAELGGLMACDAVEDLVKIMKRIRESLESL